MTNKDFMTDTHVLKALHGLRLALEQAALERGTAVNCLFIVCGMENDLGGTALHGCMCDDCVSTATVAIRRAAYKASAAPTSAVH